MHFLNIKDESWILSGVFLIFLFHAYIITNIVVLHWHKNGLTLYTHLHFVFLNMQYFVEIFSQITSFILAHCFNSCMIFHILVIAHLFNHSPGKVCIFLPFSYKQICIHYPQLYGDMWLTLLFLRTVFLWMGLLHGRLYSVLIATWLYCWWSPS